MDYRPLQYRIDDAVTQRLMAEGIAPAIIRNAQRALENSVRTFDRYLARTKNRSHAWTIRQAAIVVDNGLINKWQRQVQKAEAQGDDLFDKFVIPGFAWVRFRFPEETLYPCLPVRDQNFGLIYVLRGESYATAPEILLALQAGAEIEALTSIEFEVVESDGIPERAFLPSLSKLIKERARYKAEKSTEFKAKEKLMKEIVNSLYGKTAQAVNPRKTVQVSDGQSELLGPSKITEAIMASLTTGLARAALSAYLMAIEKFNLGRPVDRRITIISCTTDGLLVGLPAPPNYTVVGDYYSNPSHEELSAGVVPEPIEHLCPLVDEVLNRFGCGDLLPILEEYLPIRQMRHSRLALTGSDAYVEIKHFADDVVSYKTRGQAGMLSTQHCSFIAKFGQRTPFSDLYPEPEERKKVMESRGVIKNTIEAQWIEGCANPDDGMIQEYNFYTLHSFKEILSGEAQDLTQKKSDRKFNSDFDCKRRFDWREDESDQRQMVPETRPFETHAHMKKYRGVVQAIRKTGQMATPDRVMERIAIQSKATRIRGGTPASLTRALLRGVLQQHIPTNKPLADYAVLATGINMIWDELGFADSPELNGSKKRGSKVWDKSDMKNAKRGLWESGLLHQSLPLEDLLERLCELVGADFEVAKQLIFVSDESFKENIGLIEAVAQAVLLAPRQGMDPFASMYVEGLLPIRQRVLNAFHPHLSELRLEQLLKTIFIPGQQSSADFSRIRRLLARLGITGEAGDACARVLAPAKPRQIEDRKPPQNAKCTELFIHALYQPDIVPFNIGPARLLHHFVEYGITKELCQSLRQRKFVGRVLSDSAANRSQIRQMCKRIGVDPLPFLDAIINR